MKIVKDEIKWIAEEVQSTAVQARETSVEIAKRMENLFRNQSHYDLPINDMSQYVWRETSYMWTPDEGEAGCAVIGASGAVPVDDSIKKELKLYEKIHPFMREQYAKNRYSDEVLYIDKKSLVVGQTTTNFGGVFPPGFDALQACQSGVTYYDYYEWVDRDKNPKCLPRWAPSPFIELVGEFVQSVHAPVYKNEKDTEMCGFVGLHYNLEWLNAETVYKSNNRVLILSALSTLIGASSSALELLGMKPYERQQPSFLAPEEVRKYIDIERNLEQEKEFEIATLAKRIKSEPTFEWTLNGQNFKVSRETAPELDFFVVAIE
jgi:hypothetical protein